jgi:hypothetical protein
MPSLYVLQVATQQMYFIHSLSRRGLLVGNPRTLSHETRSEDPGIRFEKHIPTKPGACGQLESPCRGHMVDNVRVNQSPNAQEASF